MAAKERRSLGRGLSALIPPKPAGDPASGPPSGTGDENGSNAGKNGMLNLPIEEVLPSDAQPRQVFDDKRIAELASSIQDHGILQPIVVRRRAPQQYEIVAGERRWRAAQRAGLKRIPCMLTEVSERETLTIALVENLQREDLNAIEEAEAYERLHTELGYSQIQIAQAVGKERATVANALRLLKLPESVRELVLARELSMGHARALLALENDKEIERASTEALRKGWSVRETERAVAQRKAGGAKRRGKGSEGQRETTAQRELRERLLRALGTKVDVQHSRGRGKLVIHFSSFDQLEDLLERMNVS